MSLLSSAVAPAGERRLEGKTKVLRRRLSRQGGEEAQRPFDLRTSRIDFSLLESTLHRPESACGKGARRVGDIPQVAGFLAKSVPAALQPLSREGDPRLRDHEAPGLIAARRTSGTSAATTIAVERARHRRQRLLAQARAARELALLELGR
jgi:hypothetical protein